MPRGFENTLFYDLSPSHAGPASLPHHPLPANVTIEVDEVFWVPLSELTRADTYREERWGTGPDEHPIFFFELERETVWGATARVLRQLLSAVLVSESA